jgi:hypothetical protein
MADQNISDDSCEAVLYFHIVSSRPASEEQLISKLLFSLPGNLQIRLVALDPGVRSWKTDPSFTCMSAGRSTFRLMSRVDHLSIPASHLSWRKAFCFCFFPIARRSLLCRAHTPTQMMEKIPAVHPEVSRSDIFIGQSEMMPLMADALRYN